MPDKKIVFFDIECYSDLFMVVFKDEDTYKEFVFHKAVNEELRKELRTYYKKLKKECFLGGWNSYGYDNKMLTEFLDPYENPSLEDMKHLNDNIIGNKMNGGQYVSGKHLVDVKSISQAAGLKNEQARNYFEKTQECDVPFDQPTTSTEEVQSILDYCRNDVESTCFLFEKLGRAGFESRKLIGDKYNTNKDKLFNVSTASLGCAIIHEIMYPDYEGNRYKSGVPVASNKDIELSLSKLIDQRVDFKSDKLKELLKDMNTVVPANFVSDKDKTATDEEKLEYKLFKNRVNREVFFDDFKVQFGLGGVHGFPTNTQYHNENIIDIDVAAMYPSIMDKFKLETTAGGTKLSEAMREIINLRNNAKDKSERNVYKLISNAIYGQLRNKHSIFYSPSMATAITINGQLVMLELIEQLHEAGIQLIQANTDGVTVKCGDDQESKLKDIIDAWQAKWELELTYDKYNKWFQPNVSNIFAIDVDGNYKATGCFRTITSQVCHTLGLKPNVHYKMIVDHLITGEPMDASKYDTIDFFGVSTCTRKGTQEIQTPVDFKISKNGKRTVIEWKTENVLINPHSNRYYYKKDVDNRLAVRGATGRYTKKVDNVEVMNDGFAATDIDYDRYVAEAKKELAGYLEKVPTSGVTGIDVKVAEFDQAKMTKLDKLCVELDLMEPGVDRGECPECGDPRQLVKYTENIYCHKCNYYVSIMDMKKMLVRTEPVQAVIDVPERAENAPESVITTNIDINNIPDVVFSGVIGELVDARGDRNIQHLAGALGVVTSLVCNRGYVRYSASDAKVKPTLFLAMVLPTNSNKSGFTNFIDDSLSQLSEMNKLRVINTTESGQSFLASSVDIEDKESGEQDEKSKDKYQRIVTPYRTTFVYDELSRIFASMGNTGSTLLDDCLMSYDRVGSFTKSGVNMGKLLKDKSNPKITYPSLDMNIFGNIVPDKFSSTLGGDHLITAGLTNRFLIFYSDKRPTFTGLELPSKQDYSVSDLHAVVNKINNNGADLKHAPMFPTLFTKELLTYLGTETIFKEFGDEFENPDDNTAPTSRSASMFARLLLIYMLGNGRSHITKEDINAVDWIMRLYKKSTDELLDEVNIKVNGTQYSDRQSKLEKKIERLLERNSGKFTPSQLSRATYRDKATKKEIENALMAHEIVLKTGEIQANGKIPSFYEKL